MTIVEAWANAPRAAAQASWRLMLTLLMLACGPVLLVAFALHASGGIPGIGHLLATALALPASVFMHELGHAVAYVITARSARVEPEQFGVGRWNGGAIVRWPIGPAADAAIAVAGPLAGCLPVLPLLSPGGGFLLDYPFITLFAAHLTSLRTSADDGSQLRALFTKDRSPC